MLLWPSAFNRSPVGAGSKKHPARRCGEATKMALMASSAAATDRQMPDLKAAFYSCEPFLNAVQAVARCQSEPISRSSSRKVA